MAPPYERGREVDRQSRKAHMPGNNPGERHNKQSFLPSIPRTYDAAQKRGRRRPQSNIPTAKMACATARLSCGRRRKSSIEPPARKPLLQVRQRTWRSGEKKKTGGQAPGKKSPRSRQDADSNNGLAAEAIREEPKWNTPSREHQQEKCLQRTELGICGVKMFPQQRNQRDKNLPSRELTKLIKASTARRRNLVGAKRDGLSGH